MHHSLISIVVPFYNSMNTLDSCIKSIIDQSYNNIEVLLVNDGSTDGSVDICKKYEYDKRIKYIRQTNQGANMARKQGVEMSSGDWVMFVDSDDTLLPESLSGMIQFEDEYDIILSCHLGIKYSFKRMPDEITKEEYVEKIYSRDIYVAPFAKLFRKNLFNSETFAIPNYIILGEDYLMNLKLALANERNVKIYNRAVYNRLYQKGSLMSTHRLSANYCDELCRIADSYLEGYYMPEFQKANIRQRLLFYYLMLPSVGYKTDPSHPFVKETHKKIKDLEYGGWINYALTSTGSHFLIKCLLFILKVERRIKNPYKILDGLSRLKTKLGSKC